ncbi:HipA N-terminal domain-containing protein [Fulvivirga sp.]|uniref:HipA N-terminal domain-containing protein n=1 Tax=Fulvivirga sp. TaxID=1931237 RepID=UPI0032EB4D04
MQRAAVYMGQQLCGYLTKDNGRYTFQYTAEHLNDNNTYAISLTLPKQAEAFNADHLFPFFFGLLAEGVNKKTQCRMLRIDENDHFKLLLKTAGADTIGAITIKEL